MVKEILIPKENKAQIEEVREIETNQLTEKDFFIGCPDEDGVSIDEKGVSLKAREALGGKISDDGFEAGVTSAETKAGIGLDNRISSDLSYSTISKKDDDGEVNFLKSHAGGEMGTGTEGVSAKVGIGTDLASAEAETGVKANVGIKADTGFKVEDDEMEADLGGFGVKVGKEIGFETPIGGASVDLEKLGKKIFE